MTLAAATIKIGFEFRAPLAVMFDAPEMFPLRTQRLGESIRQSKRDELRQAWFIAMRQITAFMPSTKSALGVIELRT